MNLTEKTLNSRTVYGGKILKLQVDEVLLPNGAKSFREIVRHSGGAAVLAVYKGSVLLVKQFRYAYGEAIYEIPAGKLNAGEDPMLAAARELKEETGCSARLDHLLTIYPSPGYTDEKIYIYLAKDLVRGEQSLDEGEFLNAEFMPLEKVLELIQNGTIRDAKTVAAIYKYLCAKK